MLDYLETGLFRGRSDATPGPRRRPRPADRLGAASGSRRRPRPSVPPDAASGSRRYPGFSDLPAAASGSGWYPELSDLPDAASGSGLGSHGQAAGLRRLVTDGRVLAVAAIVAVVLAVLVGTSVPLHSTQAGPGRPSATPSLAPPSPGTTAAPSPTQATAAPSASPSARSTASAGAAGSNGATPRPAAPAATAGMTAGASRAASAPATRAAQAAAGPATVVVTFTVASRGTGLFEGDVRIVDNGATPLANWQVSVALPGDRIVAVANASGLVINGIMLLEPASGAAPIPARGGVLNVFLVAAGPLPVSGACTYNQAPCA